MIVYPNSWHKEYKAEFTDPEVYVDEMLSVLRQIISKINVRHLAYSGGIDSTIILCLLSEFHGPKSVINTYTISSRDDHPDIVFARRGAKIFESVHHEFIELPAKSEFGDNLGDNAVRQFFGKVKEYTDEIICCDGIDEYMCGYYDHMKYPNGSYAYYLSRLLPDHLVPLDKASGGVKVYLPYLDDKLVDIMKNIPMSYKVSVDERKRLVVLMAERLGILNEFIRRNKYGFCDAFREQNK